METDAVPSETRTLMGQKRTLPNVQIAGTTVCRFAVNFTPTKQSVISDTPKSQNV